jgi:hypothetical protein
VEETGCRKISIPAGTDESNGKVTLVEKSPNASNILPLKYSDRRISKAIKFKNHNTLFF